MHTVKKLPEYLLKQERNGNPIQYSCLENPMDRGAWWAIYSSPGSRESDTTGQLNHHHHLLAPAGDMTSSSWAGRARVPECCQRTKERTSRRSPRDTHALTRRQQRPTHAHLISLNNTSPKHALFSSREIKDEHLNLQKLSKTQ